MPMHEKKELFDMPMAELEKIVTGCSPSSDVWNSSWPVYEVRRRRQDTARTWICFGVSTMIALVALVRTFLSN
jgi:hypothetical protein